MPVDVDEYLPASTMKWCCSKLSDLGYERGRVDPTAFVQELGMRQHEKAYRELRTELHEYFQNCSGEPILSETPIPYGGVLWQPATQSNIREDTRKAYNGVIAQPHAPEVRDFPQDGPDLQATEDDFEEQVGELGG